MFEGKFFRLACGTILILAIIFLANQVSYILKPLGTVISFILLPLMLGGFLYYLLRPMVRWIYSKIKNKNTSILLSLIIVIGVLVSIFYFGGNIVYIEIKKLINYLSQNYRISENFLDKLTGIGNQHLGFLTQLDIKEKSVYLIQELAKKLSNYNLMGIFSSLKNLGMIIILIPFVLFYLLKDEELVYEALVKFIPGKNRDKVQKNLSEIDQVLADYINTQIIIAIILGMLMFIGYLIIKLPNAFALALICAVTSLIPILGPIIGTLPAIFVAISVNAFMLIKLFIVIVVSQYLEGNIVRPAVQGEKLNIHPLVIIFLILSSITLFGVLGALFAVPVYSVARILISNRDTFKEKNIQAPDNKST